MNRPLCSALTLSFLSLGAVAEEKHIHGEAELFVAIEGKQVFIELESPADNILGFEHKPNTPDQKEKVENSMKKLANYTSLLILSGGNCQLTDSDVESPFGDHHGHKDEKHTHKEHDHHEHEEEKHDHHHDPHGEEDDHSSFHLKYTLECKSTDIKALTVSAFENFGGFEKIQMNWVSGDKQGSTLTTKAKPEVKLP